MRKILFFVAVLFIPQIALAGSQSFSYTGGDQTFTVPVNVYSITVKLWGAGGAGGGYDQGVPTLAGGGAGYTNGTISVTDGTNTFTGHLEARPSLLRKGDTSTLYWNLSDVSSCTITNGTDTWNTASSTITETTTYTLSCTGVDHSTLTEEQIVRIVSGFFEN